MAEIGRKLTVGSLFAGIGGFDLGFERAGFMNAWRCEIDSFCGRVLAAKMAPAPLYPDVTTLDAPAVDVLVGGFPCQDVSVAGKGEGLDGERSGLFFQFVRVIGALKPKWVVIENVPGLLSNRNGRDFAQVLVSVVKLGYGLEWRILDSRYFGIAQRRRRVFFVGRAGTAGRRPRAVLFEPESGAWGIETRQETRADVVATLRGRSARRGVNEPGRGGEDDSNLVVHALRENDRNTSQGPANYVIAPAVAACLNPGHEAKHSYAGDGGTLNLIAHALTSSMHKRHDEDTDTLIASALTSSLGHHGHSSPRGDGADNLVAATLLAPSGGQRTEDLNNTFTETEYGVRRLTPLECERLQGFPDAWTCLCGVSPYSTRGCKCPDTPRYKALGNAVTVPVAEWIGRRILDAELRAWSPA